MRVVAGLAFLGLLLSTAWHASILLGRDILGDAGQTLFAGIFVVWFPTVIYLQKLGPALQRGGWKALFKGAPSWFGTLFGLVFGYAILNFMMGMLGVYDMSTGFGRAASGHAMVFYAASWGIAVAAIRRHELGIEWKCQNGHDISPEAKFCEKCGAPARQQLRSDQSGA